MSSSSGGRIPESFIESVLSKTDIISLIQESVKLKKAGNNYSACCPFHPEKTPSFTVSPHKQFYHCFGCGAHGDAIHFLMEHQSLTFIDALERLAMRLGLSVPKDAHLAEKVQAKLSVTTVLNKAAEFYSTQLKHHAQAATAVTYLKRRGLTGQIAKTYGLGFAPPGWHHLIDHFEGNAEALAILQETGLVISHSSGRLYDRFRDRIMFPIRDKRGQVCGFGARVLDNSLPKYLNSPESPVFQKGHCLYGIYEALQSRQWQTAIVVEGYMDVVALAQYGVSGVVATLGTAITHHHLLSLFQQVSEIVFCFDGDKAGKAAAWKALQLGLGNLTEGRQIKFVFLPQGEDPDSFIRGQGLGAFELLVKNALPLSAYFFDTLVQTISPDSVDSRARLASIARPMIETIPQGIFKEMMFEQLAKIVASTPQVVRGQKAFRPFPNKVPPVLVKAAPAPLPFEPAYIIAAILLRAPEFLVKVNEKLAGIDGLNVPGLALLKAILTLLGGGPDLVAQDLRERLQQQGFSLTRLVECERKVALIPENGHEAELMGAVHRLVVLGREQILSELLNKAKTQTLSDEEKIKLREFLQGRESI